MKNITYVEDLTKKQIEEKFIARIDMIGFDGGIEESLYYTEKEFLLEEIKENIDIGRPYKLTIYQKDLILNLDEFY